MKQRIMYFVGAALLAGVSGFSRISEHNGPGKCATMTCGFLNNYNKSIPFWFDSPHHAGDDPADTDYYWVAGPVNRENGHGWLESGYWDGHECCPEHPEQCSVAPGGPGGP